MSVEKKNITHKTILIVKVNVVVWIIRCLTEITETRIWLQTFGEAPFGLLRRLWRFNAGWKLRSPFLVAAPPHMTD